MEWFPMSALLPAHTTPPPAPRWLVLLVLTLVVTAAHLWLLAPDTVRVPRPLVLRVRWIGSAHITPSPASVSASVSAPAPKTAAAPAPAEQPFPVHTQARHEPPRSASPKRSRLSRASGTALAEASTAEPEAAASARVAGGASFASAAAALPPPAGSLAVPEPILLPPAVTLHYRVTSTRRGEVEQGESIFTWSPAGTRYSATWELTLPLGARSQTSEGALQAGGLAPERYGYRRGSERAAHFDPEGRRVRFSANTPDAPWQPGMQDRLSTVLQLAALLAGAPARYPAGSSIRLPTAGATRASDDLWQVIGEETLDVNGQPIPCTHLRRDPVGQYDDGIDLWLAPSRDYLPARWLITRFNGDTVDQKLDAR